MSIPLEANRFFEAFEGETRERLALLVREREFTAGTVVFDEYDEADRIFLVLDGEVDLYKHAGSAGEHVLATVRPGGYFGEMGVLDGYSRSAGARIVADSLLGEVPGDEILAILENAPGRGAIRMFQRVLEHLRTLNNRYIAEVVRKEKLHTVGAMASTIIHDIKSPITGIQLVADMIGRNHADNEQTVKYCEMIRKHGDRMVAMVQELLDFSRGASNLMRERTTVEELLEEFHQLNEEFLQRHHIQFEMRPLDLPIEVDRQRMLRVLQNLVNNSVEAMGKQGGRLHLHAAPGEGGGVCLRIQDNGPGIPEEIRAKLFEPFVTHGKRNGTGLGMAITKSIVEAHGGAIHFECPPECGTVFTISLPAAAEDEPSEQAA